jgi:glutaredoxin
MTVKVEVFSAPQCSGCKEAKSLLKKVIDSVDAANIDYQEVDITEDMDRAQSVGVRSAPSIAIDGKLSFTGVPKESELKSALEAKL